jgi:hypothetical protein
MELSSCSSSLKSSSYFSVIPISSSALQQITYEEGRNMPTTRQTLVDIYHPTFRQGYQKGREHYFQEQIILTDKELVECLQSVILDTSLQEQACDDDLYYAIGQLVGQMSARVIPCQPHEDQTQSVRERFLRTLQHTCGPAEEEALLDLIGRYWHVQDQLARLLDADTFDQVLHSGEQRGKGNA